ncbi:ABC transporter transmembrane domain-containing protein [Thomasclavelia spiroformis]|uniref:ABC transporter transmembrane domain-containing protein n=1 Tax=Thomasclavelia spiroformis TaxID=29348 RepID=UPI00241EA04F|nr:ABC transporter ATP-binding protein [Thomasclavelia spiroformis]
MKKNKLQLFLFIFLSFLKSIIVMIIPLLSGNFIDALIKKPEAVTIYKFGLYFALLNILNLLISYFITILNAKLLCKMSYDLNKIVINKLQHIKISYFTNKNLSYITQKVSTDSNNVVKFILDLATNVIQNLLIVIFAIIILIRIDQEITLLIICLISIFIFIFYFTRKPIYKSTLKYKEEQALFYSKMLEQLEKIRMVKIYNLFNYYSKKFKDSFNKLYHVTLVQTKISFVFLSCENIISMIAQISLFIIGGMRIISNSMTIGMFTVLSSYFSSILVSVKYFISLSQSYIDVLVSYKRIIEYLSINNEENGDISICNLDEITFQDTSLKLGNKQIFNKLNYKFEKNNIYCIMGENGSGKTSLINVLLGLYLSDISGMIYINGIEYNRVDLYKTREHLLSFTSQELLFLNDTINKNILLGQKNINNDQIEYFLNGFGLTSSYFKNNNILVDEHSLNKSLSGGELQKISLIRQLINPKQLIVMDEPTSALDKKSKDFLLNEILKLKRDRIIIIVTHDKSFCKISDYIVNL